MKKCKVKLKFDTLVTKYKRVRCTSIGTGVCMETGFESKSSLLYILSAIPLLVFHNGCLLGKQKRCIFAAVKNLALVDQGTRYA
jgi:hypothetical protein